MKRHGKDFVIFSGNSNIELAKDIARCLNVDLGSMAVNKFSDGEIAVNVQQTVRGLDVFAVQSLCTPVNDSLMELLIMCDAFKRASAASITAVIPYYGYARQDRKVRPRDPITAKLVADMIVAAGADRVLTMDLHATQIQGFFNIPVDHLVGVRTLARHYVDRHFNGDDLVVVSPDVGGVTRSRNFADMLGAPLAIIDKRRPRANVAEVMNIVGDVRDKRAIIIDDMVDTGGSFLSAANALTEAGAKEVYGCVTHGVLSGKGIETIQNSVIRELVITDTIPLSAEKNIPKIRQMTVAPVFARAIERIYEDLPLSTTNYE